MPSPVHNESGSTLIQHFWAAQPHRTGARRTDSRRHQNLAQLTQTFRQVLSPAHIRIHVGPQRQQHQSSVPLMKDSQHASAEAFSSDRDAEAVPGDSAAHFPRTNTYPSGSKLGQVCQRLSSAPWADEIPLCTRRFLMPKPPPVNSGIIAEKPWLGNCKIRLSRPCTR